MATVDALWDQFVFKMKAYKYILQVTNLKLSTDLNWQILPFWAVYG